MENAKPANPLLPAVGREETNYLNIAVSLNRRCTKNLLSTTKYLPPPNQLKRAAAAAAEAEAAAQAEAEADGGRGREAASPPHHTTPLHSTPLHSAPRPTPLLLDGVHCHHMHIQQMHHDARVCLEEVAKLFLAHLTSTWTWT